jgi:predicted Rdx family selenoprotein
VCVDPETRWAAKELLSELDAGWLEVCKVPGREGGYVRIVCGVSCQWYRRLCASYPSPRCRRWRKPRTLIKRCHTRTSLLKLAAGQDCGPVYRERLEPYLQAKLSEAQDALCDVPF